MSEIAKADIFFLVTTVSVVVATLAGIIIAAYVIAAVREFYKVAKLIKEEGALISDDLKRLHEDFKKEGSVLKKIIKFFIAVKKRKK